LSRVRETSEAAGQRIKGQSLMRARLSIRALNAGAFTRQSCGRVSSPLTND
jgi:hypothetical protein